MSNWQVVDQDTNNAGQLCETRRLEVPGGWIYRMTRFAQLYGTESSVFVPDPATPKETA